MQVPLAQGLSPLRFVAWYEAEIVCKTPIAKDGKRLGVGQIATFYLPLAAFHELNPPNFISLMR